MNILGIDWGEHDSAASLVGKTDYARDALYPSWVKETFDIGGTGFGLYKCNFFDYRMETSNGFAMPKDIGGFSPLRAQFWADPASDKSGNAVQAIADAGWSRTYNPRGADILGFLNVSAYHVGIVAADGQHFYNPARDMVRLTNLPTNGTYWTYTGK